MASVIYHVLADITSAVSWSPNLSLAMITEGLADGSFRVDMAEHDEAGVPLAIAMLENIESGFITEESRLPDRAPSLANHHALDALLTDLLSRPEAEPWAPGYAHLGLLAGLVRHDLVGALDTLLSRPDAMTAAQLEDYWLQNQALKLDAWPAGPGSRPLHQKPYPLFHEAARQGSLPEVVACLAKHGLSPNVPGPEADHGEYALAHAASAEMVQALLEAGADPWSASPMGTPLSMAWSRRGMSASTQSDLAKVLRETSARLNSDDPREVFSHARTLTGLRALQSSMQRHGMTLASCDERGLTVADHVLLGILESPSRTSAETSRHSGLLSWLTAKRNLDEATTSDATFERLGLAQLRHGAPPPSAGQHELLLARMDSDVHAGLLREPGRAVALLFQALFVDMNRVRTGTDVSFSIPLLDRMARAADEEGPWSSPIVDDLRSWESSLPPAFLRLRRALLSWNQVGVEMTGRSKDAEVFERIAADPTTHTSQAIHALLPWMGIIGADDVFDGQVDGQGLMPNHQVHAAISKILASGAPIDTTPPDFEQRVAIALRCGPMNKFQKQGFEARLEAARLDASTSPAPTAGRRGLRM